MRQREQTRVAAGQSNEGDVAGRHAIGADAGWYRYLWKSEPVAVAERRANVGPGIDGARCREGHRGVHHRIESLHSERVGELRDDRFT